MHAPHTHTHTHTGDRDGHKITTVLATLGPPPDRQQEISYTDLRIIGNGSFGVVYQARLLESNDMVAIKKVLQDKRFKVSLTNGREAKSRFFNFSFRNCSLVF